MTQYLRYPATYPPRSRTPQSQIIKPASVDAGPDTAVVDLAATSDEALAVASISSLTIGSGATIDAAPAVGSQTVKAISAALDASSAQAVSSISQVTIVSVTTVDSSHMVTSSSQRAIGTSQDTGSAQHVPGAHSAQIGLANDSAQARLVVSSKIKSVDIAVVTDMVQVLPASHSISIGAASEASAGQQVSSTSRAQVTMAVESGSTESMGRVKVKLLGTAESTDEGESISTPGLLGYAISHAVDSTTLGSVGRESRQIVQVAIEAAVVQAIAVSHRAVASAAQESSAARPVSSTTYRQVLLAQDVSVVVGLLTRKVRSATFATSQDAGEAIVLTPRVAVGPASTTDAGWVVTRGGVVRVTLTTSSTVLSGSSSSRVLGSLSPSSTVHGHEVSHA